MHRGATLALSNLAVSHRGGVVFEERFEGMMVISILPQDQGGLARTRQLAVHNAVV